MKEAKNDLRAHRYYTVRYTALYYYKKEKDLSADDEPRGIIDLTRIHEVRQLGVKDPPYYKKNCFVLEGDLASRTHFFNCDGQIELLQWLTCLRTCVKNNDELSKAIELGRHARETSAMVAKYSSEEEYGVRRRSVEEEGSAEESGSMSETNVEGDMHDDDGDDRKQRGLHGEEEEEAAENVCAVDGDSDWEYEGGDAKLLAPETAAVLVRAEPTQENMMQVRRGIERGGLPWLSRFADSGGINALARLLAKGTRYVDSLSLSFLLF